MTETGWTGGGGVTEMRGHSSSEGMNSSRGCASSITP